MIKGYKKCIDCNVQICDHAIRCKSCARCQRIGENSPAYKNGQSQLGDLRIRCSSRDYIAGYSIWMKDIFDRDNYTCQHCGSKIKLHAHHIESYADHSELRTVIENGITFCVICHRKLHHLFNIPTAKQLQWFFGNVICTN